MQDRHAFLVLSPGAFSDRTSLVVGLPMTTASYNAPHPFAIVAAGARRGSASYVLCHQPKSLDWRARGGKRHPAKRLDDAVFADVCALLNQIIQIA